MKMHAFKHTVKLKIKSYFYKFSNCFKRTRNDQW